MPTRGVARYYTSRPFVPGDFPMTYRQRVALILVAAVALAAGLWYGQQRVTEAPAITAGASLQASMQAALLYPAPRALPAFELTRSDGTPFGNGDLTGRWTLAFFGFTNCPDVCPDSLAKMHAVREALAADNAADALQLLFVSVDPERDNPETIARYTAFFDPAIIGVSGAPERLDVLTHALGIVHQRSALDGGGYTIDHSTQLVLLDPAGRQAAIFRAPLDPKRISADLLTLKRAG